MKIAYIGSSHGPSLYQAHALKRLGHRVALIDPRFFLPPFQLMDRWLYHTGALAVRILIDRPILRHVKNLRPDMIWVSQGEYLGPGLLRGLRRICTGPIINYTNDDPFGGRDGRRFRKYLQAIQYYDLLVVMRALNIAEAKNAGAKRVLRVFMSADEIAHRPRVLSPGDHRRFGSNVAFIGTWMPERGPFLTELIRAGVPLSIWGDRWYKAPQWAVLKQCWRGPALNDADSYAKGIQAAKVNIGLLSKGNRDLHTFRSMEIPALGGLLCAERTMEHQALYREDVEAVFWSSAKECAAKCMALLSDPQRRSAISNAGRTRQIRNGNFNEQILRKIIIQAFKDE